MGRSEQQGGVCPARSALARSALAKRLLEPGPPADDKSTSEDKARLDEECVAELRASKAKENSCWLEQISRRVSRLVLVVATGVVILTMGVNDGPEQGRRLDSVAKEARSSVSRALVLLPAQDERLTQQAQDAVVAVAAELPASISRIRMEATALPPKWQSVELVTERTQVLNRVSALETTIGDLAVSQGEASPKPSVLRETLTEVKKQLGDIADVDTAPLITLPWNFDNQTAAGFVHAIVLTLLLLAALSRVLKPSGGLRFFLIGGDGRLSTSQTQAAVWTLAVFFLAAHLLLRRSPGELEALDENYLLLLGGPYAAWVISGAVTRGKLDARVLQKVKTPEAQVRDLVSDDDSRASLTDAQFFVFSMLALVVVLVTFSSNPQQLPQIEPALAMLTSAAALVYTSKKALDANAPAIYSVTPAAGAGPISSGNSIVINGSNFLPPGGGGDLDVLSGIKVRFKVGSSSYTQSVRPQLKAGNDMGIQTAEQVRESVVNPTSERVVVEVPMPLPSGMGSVAVITASGLQTSEHALQIYGFVMIT